MNCVKFDQKIKKNLKNLNLDFLGFLGFLKNLKTQPCNQLAIVAAERS